MGPSGGDVTPLDLLFDSDSAAASDCFVHISTLRMNLKVNPIGLESARNPVSNKKRITQFGDRGKGVPSFDEMMDIALVAVDFDDPTTNVRGRLIEAKVSRLSMR